jgi:hypothetical protein
MKHSQGPWLFNNCTVYQKNSGNSDGSCRSPIAFTGCFLLDDGTNTVEECQANARLIAAAPEMYAMLKDLHSSECTKGRPFEIDTTRQCGLCDLIAKVQGETP